jgi:hypothetical protein
LNASIHQFLHRQILMKASSVSLPMIESGKVENRFAERFAGNRAMMNADAADAAGAITIETRLPSFAPWIAAFAQRARNR